MKKRDEYLKRGDLSKIAKKVGCTRNTVYKVRAGLFESPRIMALVNAMIEKRKKELETLIEEDINDD